MSSPKVIIVTGASKGIGLAITQKFLNLPDPVHVYACSRSGTSVSAQPANPSSKLHATKLDISDPSSIKSLFSTISSSEKRLDVLVNNAGTNDTGDWDVPAPEVVAVNYGGTKDACLTFLPLMAKTPGSRIVNVSSVGSKLHHYSDEIKATFRDPKLTLPRLDDLAKNYSDAVAAGKAKGQGFGDANGYAVSKACINSLTAILAREYEGKVVVNCCCPGWVATDMGSIMGQPPKTPEEGARIPFRLATGDVGGVTGKYWENPSIRGSGEGQVGEW